MIKWLEVGNFKAFGATQRVPLKPLTLVYGPNSAGKSSVIHALAFVHEAMRTGSLDVVNTQIGGRSIDLGGFRQFVFKRNAANRVELGVAIDRRQCGGRLAELLGGVSGDVSLHVTLAVRLDDEGRPVRDAEPAITSYELRADGEPAIKASPRPDGRFALDVLDARHPLVRFVLRSAIEAFSTTGSVAGDDWEAVDEAVGTLVSRIDLEPGALLPRGVKDGRGPESADRLVAIGRGTRKADLARAVEVFLPGVLGELLALTADAVDGAIRQLVYLGPLRSYPPRHMAFSDHDDPNWQAGGGYAWDVVRRQAPVRDEVNRWLNAPERLQTPYELKVRELVAGDQLARVLSLPLELLYRDAQADAAGDERFSYQVAMQLIEDLEAGVRRFEQGFRSVRFDEEDRRVLGMSSDEFEQALYEQSQKRLQELRASLPIQSSDELLDTDVARVADLVARSDIDRVQELVLVDRRTDTTVSHRDVGIGISQVLPVLVSAYGSRQRLVAIEQPEIHLHPRLQAELGDVFIESALGPTRNTLLLETHSEHLILRILRRIRETSEGELPEGVRGLTPDDVAVLYVEPGKDGSRVIHLPVTPDGDFSERWPNGFFAERAAELF